MFCGHCGKSIPDDGKFCCYCGASTQGAQGDQESITWEFCETIWFSITSVWGYGEHLFRAEAIGPNGIYNAGESPHYKGRSLLRTKREIEDRDRAYKVLINQLVKDGWEPTGEIGDHWWRKKFRRKVKAT